MNAIRLSYMVSTTNLYSGFVVYFFSFLRSLFVSTSLQTAITRIPEDLQHSVLESFLVPQFGPYHCEGPFMESHLEHALDSLKKLSAGFIVSEVPSELYTTMAAAVRAVGIQTIESYVLLHDLNKKDRLSLKLSEESSLKSGSMGLVSNDRLQLSWDDWVALFGGSTGEDLRLFCEKNGILQISYFHESPTDNKPSKHGAYTAEFLEGRIDIPHLGLICLGIKDHELCKTFEKVNLAKASEIFQGLSDLEVGFIFAANYADLAASHRLGGVIDLSSLFSMWYSYSAYKKYGELVTYLSLVDRLDHHRLEKYLSKIRKSDVAFLDQTVEEAVDQAIQVCQLKTFSGDQVLSVLTGIDLDQTTLSQVIEDMTGLGKISKETGKVLGAKNKVVRQALATIR